MMDLRKEEHPTEYMKIRKQLLNLVFKAGPTPVRLASSRELGKRFGVTHMTVARVMKDLEAQLFIPETAEVLEATIAFQIERSASTNPQ